MVGLDLKLIIIRDQAFLAHDHPLTFEQIGFPGWAVAFYSPAYYVITVIKYNDQEHSLFAVIKSYQNGSTDFDAQQMIWENELQKIKKIKFRGISMVGLSKTMHFNRPMQLPSLKEPEHYTEAIHTLSFDFNEIHETEEEEIKTIPIPEPVIQSSPAPVTIIQKFAIPIKDIRFVYGGVTFKKYLEEIDQEVEFTIHNECLREEFDAIKNYFISLLQTKRIQVYLDAIYHQGALEIKNIGSPEIRKINKTSIEQVKFEFVKNIPRFKIKKEIDKSLFTMDEFLHELTNDKFKSNTFYNSDKDLLEDILQVTNTKHYKHLRYLSSIHAAQIMKLRFILKPFSFVFLIEGTKKYHIVWETLDSEEATYVWHIDKDLKILKLTIQKIEDIINTIKVQGKIAYINTSEDPFRRVFHDYSELVDGFVKWKGELESILY